MERLVDTHCHILSGSLREDSEGAYSRAVSTGVTRMLLVGIDAASSEEGVAFAKTHPGVHPTVGIHPNDCGSAGEEDFARVRRLAEGGAAVAVGETGLDFYRDTVDPKTQIRSLEWHAELGIEFDLPLVLHVREAFPRLGEVLEPFARRGLRAVLHCFGSGPEHLDPYLDWGFMVSFSGVLTYPKAGEIRAAALRCPADRLLVETDAPWLAPEPKRGRQNEPAFVRHTAERLAALRGLGLAEAAELTTENAVRFFRLSSLA